MVDKISIASTSHKHSEYIRDWANGLLVQELPDGYQLEVNVVVDGNESEEDLQEMLTYDWESANIDFRVQYNYTNKGGPTALTQALDMCTGKYIGILDCDDYYLPNKIKRSIEYVEENNLDAVHHDIDCILPSGEYRKEAWSKTCWQEPIVTMDRLLEMNTIYTCSFIAKSDWVVLSPSPLEFSKAFLHLGDYSLFSFMCYNGAKIGWLNESLSVYRDSIGINNKDRDLAVQLDSKVREWGRRGCKWEELQ